MARAFTLVELLVVITIIIVLLALLVPAMDRAIYQAELAVCGAQQRAVASGVTGYALDSRRSYPARTNLERTDFFHKETLAEPKNGYDVRPLLEPRMPPEALVDPLTTTIQVGIAQTQPDSIVYSTYALWFGFGFAGQAKMSRMGDRFTWVEGSGAQAVTYRFSALVSDFDDINEPQTGWPSVYGSHPDSTGLLWQQVVDNEVAGVSFAGVSTWGSGRFVLSRWIMEGIGRHDRGPVDKNVAFSDGSVERYAQITYDEWDRTGRMIRVPPGGSAGINAALSHDYLPPR